MNGGGGQEHPFCHGYCPDCGREHSLPAGGAVAHCHALMATLAEKGRLDFTGSEEGADPLLSTTSLFFPAGGKMFGVMECQAPDGTIEVHRAFSGQYNGQWEVAGWVPPVFNVQAFDRLTRDTEREVKRLGRVIAGLAAQSPEQRHCVKKRKELSRQLMQEIHGLYRLRNFRGEKRPLSVMFSGGVPTGTGDCCAPKLLQYAAGHDLIPLSLAEFYWGGENLSATRRHGRFYASCPGKCHPILGFMLCGL